jgi:hypothetical protein
MQVVSLAPVPVASLAWRVGEGSWSLAVICKLTFQLTPGEARLAKRHDPIYERERFPDDDRGASLYAPSDLVPSRPLTDVTVVGSVFAPRSQPTSSLTARLKVQTIDKSLLVEVAPTPRGKPFKSAPLGYEYAEPSPTNPVGCSLEDGSFPHSTRATPVVDPSATNPGHTSPGFGPIASHWSARKDHLEGELPDFQEGSGPYELASGFDMKVFNAAPPDQQLPELAANCEIHLENLHPDHAMLQTRLPNVAPQVFVERRGATRREEYETRISGLWIDTRRSVATVTWHAQVALDRPDEPGRVWVAVAGPGTRLSLSQLSRLIGSLSGSQDGAPISSPEDEATTDESSGHDVMGRTVSIKAKDRHKLRRALEGNSDEVTKTSVLSKDHMLGDEDTERAKAKSASAAKGADEPPKATSQPPKPGKPPKRKASPPSNGQQPKKDHLADVIEPAERTADGIMAPAKDEAPAWLAPGSRRSPSVPPPPPKRNRTASSPPSAPPASPVSSGIASNAAAPVPAQRGPAITHPGLGPTPGSVAASSPWPTTHVVPNRDDRLADTSSLPGAEELASGIAPHDRKAKARKERIPDEVVELLWFDEESTKRLRKRWPKLCDELEFAPRDDRHDSTSDDPARARRHHLHFGVLTEAPTSDVSRIRHDLRDAISEGGRFTPPLIVLRGTLRFPFDPVEVLRATAATVKPISGEDKKLTEALAQVDELLETPLISGNMETITNFTKHLRKLYQESRRSLSIEYLDETVERMLLEQRRYQKRTLFGGPCIRALLTSGSDDKGIPTYLPEDLADALPMMTSFNARLVAEGHVRQDQYEAHAHALRVITLGRIIRLD